MDFTCSSLGKFCVVPLNASGGKSSPEKVPSSLPGLSQEPNCPQRAIQTFPWGRREVDHCAFCLGWTPGGIGKGIWKKRAGSTQHFYYLIYDIKFWLLVKWGYSGMVGWALCPWLGAATRWAWRSSWGALYKKFSESLHPRKSKDNVSITDHRRGPWWMDHSGGAGQTQNSWGSLARSLKEEKQNSSSALSMAAPRNSVLVA